MQRNRHFGCAGIFVLLIVAIFGGYWLLKNEAVRAAVPAWVPVPSALAQLAEPEPSPTAVASSEDTCYEAMRASVLAQQDTVMLAGATNEQFDAAYRRVMEDPELFCVSNCSYTCFADGVEVEWHWNCTDYAARLAAAQATADAVASGIDAAASDYDKALYVHDWLCQNVTYKGGDNAIDQNIYGALGLREAVCSGYCNAFTYLLQKLGVNAFTVVGTDNEGEPHAWNGVWMDGELYYCDVTWDDQEALAGGAYVSHSWFGLTSAQMRGRHTPDGDSAMPDTAATACNYYVHNGWMLESWDEARFAAIMAAQVGKPILTVRCADEACYHAMHAALFEQNRAYPLMQQAGFQGDLTYTEEPELYTLTFLT